MQKANFQPSISDFDFIAQKLSSDDVYFDGINLTFWRCILHLSTKTDGFASDKKVFSVKNARKIEKYRRKNKTFDAIVRILLSNFDNFAGSENQKRQFFQCFRTTDTIYQESRTLNYIITGLYKNKVLRNNLLSILKDRIPASRDAYDAKLKNWVS